MNKRLFLTLILSALAVAGLRGQAWDTLYPLKAAPLADDTWVFQSGADGDANRHIKYSDLLALFGTVEDDAFGAGWNGDTANAPSQNSLYDYLILGDTDGDGLANVADATLQISGAAPTITNSSAQTILRQTGVGAGEDTEIYDAAGNAVIIIKEDEEIVSYGPNWSAPILEIGGTSADGLLRLWDNDVGGDATVDIAVPNALGTSWVFTLPPNNGDAGQVLRTDGSGVTSWVAHGGLGSALSSTTNDLTSTGDLVVKLGDNAGVNALIIQDSDSNPVFQVNSNGEGAYAAIATDNLTFEGLLDLGTWEALDNTGTPSVAGGSLFETGGTTTITDFDDGVEGQVIYVQALHSLTFDVTGTDLQGGTVDIVAGDGDILKWVSEDGTIWKLVSFIDASVDVAGGGAETNSLETTITGIADGEIFVGDGNDSGTFVPVSGDATMANTGALTIPAKFQSWAVADLGDATTPSVLTAAETNNKLISNYKATGADHVFTMPAAHTNGNVTFVIGDEFQVDIEPNSGDNFYLNGTAMAADEHIQNTSDTLMGTIVGVCVNVNGTLKWSFKTDDTNWVEETP